MRGNMATSEQTVIFVHIPKTAGTTMYQVIQRNYASKAMYVIGVDGWHDEFKRLSDCRKAELLLIGGHAGFGMHRFLPKPCAYFTILRDPIERTISDYYYIRRTPQSGFYDQVNAKNISLLDFLNLGLDALVDNGQTRLLCGLENGFEVGFGECTREMLETAKRNLRDHFVVVGLTEEFDATLILLKKALGWRKLAYARQNVSPNRLKQSEISQVTLDAIARVNVLDAELYDYARTLFEEQVRQQGASFAQEVKDFQKANQWLGPLVRLYLEARKVSVRTMLRQWIQRRHGSPARA